jgi:hypothetical protein
MLSGAGPLHLVDAAGGKPEGLAQVAPGDSQCIHLRGPGGGWLCIVQVVLGSQLVRNSQVTAKSLLLLSCCTC